LKSLPNQIGENRLGILPENEGKTLLAVNTATVNPGLDLIFWNERLLHSIASNWWSWPELTAGPQHLFHRMHFDWKKHQWRERSAQVDPGIYACISS
jgi:hypothetical protein